MATSKEYVTGPDQITLGVSHQITVGRTRQEAWVRADVSRTIRPGESAQDALSATAEMLEEAVEAVIAQTVERIEGHA